MNRFAIVCDCASLECVLLAVSADTDFYNIMAKIVAWVFNRFAPEGVTMDVGKIGGDECLYEDL
jgi:hypothetical protein